MAVTAYKTPGICANEDQGAEDWVSPDNAKTSNDAYSSVSLPKIAGASDILLAGDYGFSIPSGATIDGIEVKIEHKGGAAGSIADVYVQLTKASILVGDNKASASKWATSDGEITYPASGGATDKWGTTWTVADINNEIGLGLRAQNSNADNAVTAYVDCISIRIYYTEAPTFIPWAIIM